jgi:Tol biopolymer transport system component
LIAHIYGVGGKLGTFVGGTVTVGYVIGSAAATMYMFLDWNPEGSVFVPYLDVGLGLMIVGGMAALIGIAIRRQVCIHALPKTVRVVKRHSRFRILGKPLISVFLALLVTVSAVSAAIMMPPPGPGLAPGLRQLTSGPWEDRYPTWSPSGQLIAYITSRDGLDSVWVIRPNGLSDRRVSPVDVKAEYPSWAPNSASLAYYCLDGQRQGICVTNVADKSWKVVTDDSVVVVESRPQWSRDGSKLLFFRKGGNISLSVLDLPTGNTANIARMGDGNYSASWLSGSELVYSTRTGNHCEMKIVNLETGKNRTVFGDDENYVLPRVSPNGSKLSFFSDRPAPSETTLPIDVGDTGGIVPGIMIGGFNLWMSNLDGSDATYQYVLGHLWRDTEVPLQIPYSPGMIYLAQPPVWSDDSTKIAYVSLGSLTGYGIYVWDTATRSTVHIGSFQGDSLDPSWSPKGTDLLFSNNASGHCHIFIAYSAGAGTPQVAPAY